MKLTDLNTAIEVLVEAIKTDYREYTDRGAIARIKRGGDGEYSDINKQMIEEFENGFEISEGKKYIKVISNRSVWGFIVKNDDGKFKRGDILKAASWAAPAKNAARGNVFDGGYSICWTGPHYLK